jgi:SOS-response transcriptional repressor LexA
MNGSIPLTDRLRNVLSELQGGPDRGPGLKYVWSNRWRDGHLICGQIEIWPSSDYSDPEVIGVPLVGPVGAGSALQYANQDGSTYVTVPRNFLGRGDRTRAYEVQGDSMLPFIEEGDLALVEEVLSPFELRDRDVLLVRRGDEISLRSLQRRDGQVWLTPYNPTRPAERFKPGWMEILGRMVALMPRTSWQLGIIVASPEMLGRRTR